MTYSIFLIGHLANLPDCWGFLNNSRQHHQKRKKKNKWTNNNSDNWIMWFTLSLDVALLVSWVRTWKPGRTGETREEQRGTKTSLYFIFDLWTLGTASLFSIKKIPSLIDGNLSNRNRIKGNSTYWWKLISNRWKLTNAAQEVMLRE